VAKKLSTSGKKANTKKVPTKPIAKPKKVSSEKPAGKSAVRVSLKEESVGAVAKEALKKAVSKKIGEEKSKPAQPAKKSVAKSKGKHISKLSKEAASAQLSELGKKWLALYQGSETSEAIPYKMTETYEPQMAIHHEVLGWGYILSKNNDRLEVIFKDGIRHLISNYRR
jgi:hypothetical protein